LKIDGAVGHEDWNAVIPVNRCPMRMDSGRFWPRYFSRCGFESKRSNCDGAPDWKRKITRFARGAKCGNPARPVLEPSPDCRPAASPSSFINDASAAVPRPVPQSPKKCLRVIIRLRSSIGFIVSAFIVC
jgi:hypothetical protein